jgi:hypothetical protein
MPRLMPHTLISPTFLWDCPFKAMWINLHKIILNAILFFSFRCQWVKWERRQSCSARKPVFHTTGTVLPPHGHVVVITLFSKCSLILRPCPICWHSSRFRIFTIAMFKYLKCKKISKDAKNKQFGCYVISAMGIINVNRSARYNSRDTVLEMTALTI